MIRHNLARAALFILAVVALLGCSVERPPETLHHLAFHPDGQKVIFSYGVTNEEVRLAQVDVASEQITYFPKYKIGADDLYWSDPAYSPDGSKIAFEIGETSGNSHIAIMDASGLNAAKVTSETGVRSRPSFSPDGNKLVYFKGRQRKSGATRASSFKITEFDLATGEETAVGDFSFWIAYSVNYAGNADNFIFSGEGILPDDLDILKKTGIHAYRDKYRANNIFRLDRKFVTHENLIPIIQQGHSTLSRDVSEDGRTILFLGSISYYDEKLKGNNGGRDMFVLRDKAVTRVSEFYKATHGAISRDGTRVAFTGPRVKSKGYGDKTIWIVNSDGSNSRELSLNLKAPKN